MAKQKQANIAKVAAYAEMVDFPCTKQELLQMADEQEFPDEVLDVLEDLPMKDFSCESELVNTAADLAEVESERPEYAVEAEQ